MSPARTEGPDTWQVPDVAALRGLAPAPSRWRMLGHPRRLLAATLAFPPLLWALRGSLAPTVEPSSG